MAAQIYPGQSALDKSILVNSKHLFRIIGVSPWSLLIASAVSLFVGIASGVYPARQAAKLDPIEALRHS